MRWNQLPGNTAYPSTNLVVITSTDVTTSNSAAMYASIASYVSNHNRVLESHASVDEVVNQVSPLFLEQDKTQQSTEALFHDYLSKGEGTTPMAMIPEAAFVARAAAHDGSIRPNMVLMYPDPDVLSKATLVPFTRAGDTVGRLLSDDPGLQHLAIEHGFRITAKPAAFGFLRAARTSSRWSPRARRRSAAAGDILEALMTRINAALHVTLGPRPGPAASVESRAQAVKRAVPTRAGHRSRGTRRRDPPNRPGRCRRDGSGPASSSSAAVVGIVVSSIDTMIVSAAMPACAVGPPV